MTDEVTRPKPFVSIFRDPWPVTCPTTQLFDILTGVAVIADAKFVRMMASGEIKRGRDSLGAVLLDPTRPGGVHGLDLVLATIEFGPRGRSYLPNGFGKAEPHYWHGRANDLVIQDGLHLLSDKDFGVGNSAEYRGAIGGGSGLLPEQDGDFVYGLLEGFVEGVDAARTGWFADRRQGDRKQYWATANNTAPATRAAILDLVALRSG